jgi:hypothetical protein
MLSAQINGEAPWNQKADRGEAKTPQAQEDRKGQIQRRSRV